MVGVAGCAFRRGRSVVGGDRSSEGRTEWFPMCAGRRSTARIGRFPTGAVRWFEVEAGRSPMGAVHRFEVRSGRSPTGVARGSGVWVGRFPMGAGRRCGVREGALSGGSAAEVRVARIPKRGSHRLGIVMVPRASAPLRVERLARGIGRDRPGEGLRRFHQTGSVGGEARHG